MGKELNGLEKTFLIAGVGLVYTAVMVVLTVQVPKILRILKG